MFNDSRGLAPRASGVVSAVLGGLLFMLVCAFILLMAVSTINAARIIQNTDVAHVLMETGMSNATVDLINSLPFVENRVDIYDVDEFIRNEVVSQEISRALEGYLAAFAEGNFDHHITQYEVLHIARNLEPELSYMFGHSMSESDYEILTRILEDVVDFRILSIDSFVDAVGMDLTIPQFVASGNFLILVGVLCVIILILMVLHHRRRLSDAFKNAGGPILLAGVTCFLLGFVISSYTQLLGGFLYRISTLLSGPISIIMTYSLYATLLGIALLIVHLIFIATRPRQI